MSRRTAIVLGLLLMAGTALLLLAMGRVPICTCGIVKLWSPASDVSGSSQHLSDWYTPSHIIHGFLFCGLTWLILRARPLRERVLIAMVIEAAWELAENSPWIIDRYREATIAAGYTGDSVLNSMSDITAMLIGFWFASRAPVWLTVLIAIGFELLALWAVRDNLTLNVLMLVWPIQAIKTWQGSL